MRLNNTEQFRDLSSLFMRSEVKQWMGGDFRSIDAKLQHHRLIARNRGKTYLSFLRSTYRNLSTHYPNEYFLKNEFLSREIKALGGSDSSVVFNQEIIECVRVDRVV